MCIYIDILVQQQVMLQKTKYLILICLTDKDSSPKLPKRLQIKSNYLLNPFMAFTKPQRWTQNTAQGVFCDFI